MQESSSSEMPAIFLVLTSANTSMVIKARGLLQLLLSCISDLGRFLNGTAQLGLCHAQLELGLLRIFGLLSSTPNIGWTTHRKASVSQQSSTGSMLNRHIRIQIRQQ
jgi:hypothetical protein